MKYNSNRRMCLFNKPQWRWHGTEEVLDYPSLTNIVNVQNRSLGAYTVTVAVPSEIYIVMKQKGIKRVDGFSLIGRVFSMDTEQGRIHLWVYTGSIPKWLHEI